MRRSVAALAAVLLLSALAGCGDDSNDADSPTSVSSSQPTTEPAQVEYEQLTEKQLRDALVTIADMPPGYAADPVDDDPGSASYCGAKPDRAPTRANQDFTKGGGFTMQLATVGLSQYPSAEVATTNFERLREGLRTCAGETIDGDEVTYTVMSTPQTNYPTLGIRATADSFTAMVYAAQVGSTMVTAGTAGLTNSDADLAVDLLVKQIRSYEEAARAETAG